MPARLFVDTNIWLYALVADDGNLKHRLAAEFVLGLTRPLVNSQVIREASSNLLKKAGIEEPRLRAIVGDWYRDCEIHPSNATQHLLASKLRQSHRFSYWDSLIVAAALDAGCSALYSEDMQHGQIIDDRLTVINPLISP
ncbi:putative nucleic-acid-binding protein, contains PIN domain [Thiorhodovibrio winogradskyi]|uniref:Nucleic-acid-binding protein, contains PIN domain n=1 Tax=Thiorhodovibrio winogradskyi TaxID=77007 RepID=A0ABZ0SAA6_9GAMM|nr:PIN domain-containing protein [Thiorhodovibrio winogradskyi]